MLRISVGRNGEDYPTIQEALDSVPYDVEAEIAISEGIYREKIFSDKRSLALKGIGDVVITWSDSARQILDDGRRRGTFRSYTAFFSGSFRLNTFSDLFIDLLLLKGYTLYNSITDLLCLGTAVTFDYNLLQSE